MASDSRFYCVTNASVPEATTQLLEQACRRRQVAYHEVCPATFDYDPQRHLCPGDLLYRPASSAAAVRTEQFLFVRY